MFGTLSCIYLYCCFLLVFCSFFAHRTVFLRLHVGLYVLVTTVTKLYLDIWRFLNNVCHGGMLGEFENTKENRERCVHHEMKPSKHCANASAKMSCHWISWRWLFSPRIPIICITNSASRIYSEISARAYMENRNVASP